MINSQEDMSSNPSSVVLPFPRKSWSYISSKSAYVKHQLNENSFSLA